MGGSNDCLFLWVTEPGLEEEHAKKEPCLSCSLPHPLGTDGTWHLADSLQIDTKSGNEEMAENGVAVSMSGGLTLQEGRLI